MYLLLYVASVVLVNILFSYVQPIATPIGMLSPVAVVVGATFVLRDFAQRYIGHHVLWGMVAATVLSYAMAHPAVATASALAFAASELVDWLLYTYTRKPFHQRVFISSLLSTPVDTVVFLWWIGTLTPGTLVLMFLSKMLAAVAVYAVYASRDRKEFEFG
jgi:uncharacterized PurR-regulated membrane protein YhhQ (DUF165 family)